MSGIGRRFVTAIAALFCIFLTVVLAPADAAQRVALVVGNSSYKFGPLDNPARDAALVASALKTAGVDLVVFKTNIGLDEFRLQLARFREVAAGADIALFYFAGHGVESQGKNWLIPVDAALRSERSLSSGAIPVDEVLAALSGASMRILALDACRDNPLIKNGHKGLARMEDDDVLILFAAAPGKTASDGTVGDNGPFAKALARRLAEPGLSVQDLGLHVRFDVIQATRMAGQPQSPHVSSNIKPDKVVLVPSSQRRLDFNAGFRGEQPSYTVVAEPELRNSISGMLIGIENLEPRGSRVVLVNNKGIYEGRSIEPTVSDNFLTQIDTGNKPAAFTLTFSTPVKSVSFMVPRLFTATASGVTSPAWRAAALSQRGEELASVSEGLLRHMPDMGDAPARTFKLTAPAFEGIAGVRFASDPNLNGQPFAAFSTILIEQITLEPY